MRRPDGTLVLRRGEAIPPLDEEERLRMLAGRPKGSTPLRERVSIGRAFLAQWNRVRASRHRASPLVPRPSPDKVSDFERLLVGSSPPETLDLSIAGFERSLVIDGTGTDASIGDWIVPFLATEFDEPIELEVMEEPLEPEQKKVWLSRKLFRALKKTGGI